MSTQKAEESLRTGLRMLRAAKERKRNEGGGEKNDENLCLLLSNTRKLRGGT